MKNKRITVLPFVAIKMPPTITPVRATLIGASVGIALIAVLATYLKRKRRRRPYRDIVEKQIESVDKVDGMRYNRIRRGKSPVDAKSQNGGR